LCHFGEGFLLVIQRCEIEFIPAYQQAFPS
jgi:hypothetical protein